MSGAVIVRMEIARKQMVDANEMVQLQSKVLGNVQRSGLATELAQSLLATMEKRASEKRARYGQLVEQVVASG
ncbi:MAG: hypothetical protein ABIP38_14765 [Steroidobacteraceae bacterium]